MLTISDELDRVMQRWEVPVNDQDEAIRQQRQEEDEAVRATCAAAGQDQELLFAAVVGRAADAALERDPTLLGDAESLADEVDLMTGYLLEHDFRRRIPGAVEGWAQRRRGNRDER